MPSHPAHQSHPRRHRGWIVLAPLALGSVVLAACSSTPKNPGAIHIQSTKATATTTTTTAPPPTCPLTGEAVPGGGGVPQRPAIGVKVDNYPDARPQSGLDKADVIFEEPVEGGITRYVAVFQCQEADSVGPVRSARNIDIGILGQLGAPLEVHVGGIDPVIANIDASPIVNVDLGNYGNIATHPAGRVAPYDTYSSTSAMWGTHPSMTTPPQALFNYSATAPGGGTPAAAIGIDFSGTSNVTWKWNPTLNVFQRYYNSTQADTLADGVQNAATNVVVQYVSISLGPWLENSEGGLEVQADLYPNASGNAEVFRNGVAIPGTWHRGALGSPTQFETANGQPITLAPGQTWVELVPNTITATVTP